MKKLIIAGVIAVVSVFANASSVDWQIQASTKGLPYYVFNGDFTTAISTALSNTEVGGTSAFNTWIATVDSGKKMSGTFAGTKGAASGFSLTTVADSLTFLVFDSTIADGNTYKLGTVSTSGLSYLAPPEGQQTSPGKVKFNYAGGAGTAGTIAAASVPEPTSAMFLLLGVAGLALRRRRA